jgi:ABC-type transporter Mla MlaB component
LATPYGSPTTPVSALRPPRGPKTIVLVVGAGIPGVAVPGLCDRVRRLLEGGVADLITCEVSALADPDAVTIDALARLQLTARRLGRSIRLRNACRELQDLLALTGLREVLPLCTGASAPAAWAGRRVGTSLARRRSGSR